LKKILIDTLNAKQYREINKKNYYTSNGDKLHFIEFFSIYDEIITNKTQKNATRFMEILAITF